MKEEKKLMSLQEFTKLSPEQQSEICADAILGNPSNINWKEETKSTPTEAERILDKYNCGIATLKDTHVLDGHYGTLGERILCAMQDYRSLPSKEVQQSDIKIDESMRQEIKRVKVQRNDLEQQLIHLNRKHNRLRADYETLQAKLPAPLKQ